MVVVAVVGGSAVAHLTFHLVDLTQLDCWCDGTQGHRCSTGTQHDSQWHISRSIWLISRNWNMPCATILQDLLESVLTHVTLHLVDLIPTEHIDGQCGGPLGEDTL